MRILVDNKTAVLKKNFSFDYISENRLFLGRDGYTLNIVFPLKGCVHNIDIFGHINRLDVAKNNIHFDCSIIDGKRSLFGTLSVVKISEVEVECQFAEGRCSQIVNDPFQDTYITDLDLGSPDNTSIVSITPADAWKSIDSGADAVALPWINEAYPTAANNWVKFSSGTYKWDEDNGKLSWQPYLITIAKRICMAINYSFDFSEWEKSSFRHLIVCNVLPGTYDMPEYAHALPRWTVSDFFEKLELLMMCEFDFDHKSKSIEMHFSSGVIDNIKPVKLESLVDKYSGDISHDDDVNCDYIAANRLAYKQCSHSLANFYACDWFTMKYNVVKRYDTLAELISKNKRRDSIVSGQTPRVYWGEQVGGSFDPRRTTVDALMYAADVDTYYVFRSIGTEKIGSMPGSNRDVYTQVYVLQPVNIFGSGSLDDDSVQTSEIEFVPVCIKDTYVSSLDDKGYMMFMSPPDYNHSGSASDSSAGLRPGSAPSETVADVNQSLTAKAISNGESKQSQSSYEEIYIAFWDGSIPENGRTPYPIIDSISMVSQSWTDIHRAGRSLRLFGEGGNSLVSKLPQIDPKQKFHFSWIDTDIPNPRAIFYIEGRRYLCEKITATFSETGMSQLLKGEFYPLLD